MMARKGAALGFSYIPTQDAVGSYKLDLTEIGIPVEGIGGVEALRLVCASLEQRVLRAELGEVSLTRIYESGVVFEAGLLVDVGPTEGAAVTASAPMLGATEVELVVARSSPWLRRVMWVALGAGLLLGVLVMRQLQLDVDRKLLLILGLAVGLAVAVIALTALSATRALVGGRSEQVTQALDAVVRSWAEGPATSDGAPRPAKKRRRRRRKKKRDRATPEDD